MSSDALPPDFDIYAFLDLTPAANATQIRKAYRLKSLLYHPDKNPSPSAAKNFHYLNLAVEILESPTARVGYDQVRKARAAKAERTAKYDTERRRLQRELEGREREAKRRRMENLQGMNGMNGEEGEGGSESLESAVEKLRKESERLKRERDRRMREALEREKEEEVQERETDESQRTVKVRFQKGVDRKTLSTERLEDILSKYGGVENVLLGKSALVIFETITGAKAAVQSKHGESPLIKEISMAESKESKSDNPESIPSTEKENPAVNTFEESKSAGIHSGSATKPPRFSFKPTVITPSDGADYESITLLRMRKLEKERLEREILMKEKMEMESTPGVET
jgi:DnaJ homolog subfamily C member 17